MLEFKIRDADHLDEDLMEEAEGKILNVNYWHSAGKRMLVFVDVMIALGFDFGRIDKFEEEKGRDWKEKDWQSQKVFREVEDAGPIMDIIVAYQRDDDDKIKTDDKGNPYWDIDIDLDSIISNERIIEHIATVRHITNQADGLSAALELTDLNDDGVNELIRATNETLIHINRQRNLEQTKMNKNRIEDLVAV